SIAVSLIPIIISNSAFVIFGLCLISDNIFFLVAFKPCFLVAGEVLPISLPTLLPTFLFLLNGRVTTIEFSLKSNASFE
ncbi:MAG: hypothetical protein SOV57_07210, partial [Bacilli bacterium]|nr:hypothetical protein [Bacilli bacterium]